MLTIMVGCVIVPGLPSIANALGVGGQAGWLVTLPALGVVLFGPMAGRLIDRIGTWRALAVGLILYGALGLGTVLLHGAVQVFSSRVLLGGATALIMAGGTGLISEFYQGDQRLTMIARQGMAIELGGVVFLALGGMLTNVGWYAPFALYAMAFVFLGMVVATIPIRGRGTAPVNMAMEDEAGGAMWTVRVAALCSMTVFFTAVILLPFRLSGGGDGVQFSEAQTGYFLSFVSLVAVCAAALMPRLVRARGGRKTLMIAFACYEVAHLCFAFAADLPLFILGGVLLGCGFGLSVPLVNHMTVERSTVRSRGRNLAYLSMALFLGQFLASFLEYVPGGTQSSFLAAAAVAFFAGVGCFKQKAALRAGT
ncbi:hypothetical protein ASB57_05895 [Bordetella sp. N]|nr:hypothetical protein ASB57_05895 [Bordetella sp. N]